MFCSVSQHHHRDTEISPHTHTDSSLCRTQWKPVALISVMKISNIRYHRPDTQTLEIIFHVIDCECPRGWFQQHDGFSYTLSPTQSYERHVGYESDIKDKRWKVLLTYTDLQPFVRFNINITNKKTGNNPSLAKRGQTSHDTLQFVLHSICIINHADHVEKLDGRWDKWSIIHKHFRIINESMTAFKV